MKLKQNAIETNYNPSQDDKFLKTIGGLFLSRQVCQRLTFIHFTSLRGSSLQCGYPCKWKEEPFI